MPGAPRFSLLNTLLLMTIIGLTIVVVQLWREVGPLREEVRGLRNEVGRISVDDPTKLHAIRVDTADELTWKWRIWVPENRVYVIRCFGQEVPKDGFPSEGGSIWLREPGEHVIQYRIERDRRDDKWYGQLETVSGSVGKDLQPWVSWSSKTSTSGGVGNTTRSFDADERVELIRHRVSQSGDSTKIEDPAAGFMIWLEPAK
jgi:hypothetical protein